MIVQVQQRADTQRGEAERAGQFGNHDARRGPKRVLPDIEQQAEAPGDDEADMVPPL